MLALKIIPTIIAWAFIAISPDEKVVVAADLQVPQVEKPAVDPAKKASVIQIQENGTISFANKAVTAEELTNQLKLLAANDKESIVLIKASAETPYQNIIGVIDLCGKAGLSNITMTSEITKTTP